MNIFDSILNISLYLGSIDGIIVLVGTSDGRLSLLSESASLLFSHRFVNTPITAMRTTDESGER